MIALPISHKSTPRPVDVSVIIAHRGPEMGLWATLESCIIDLEASGLTYEFRVCSNGDGTISEDLARIKYYLEKGGHLGEFIHVPDPLAPPTARQIISENANGKFLFVFDNHCLVARDYFLRGVSSCEKYGIDFLHSTTRFFTGEGNQYEYILSLKRDFWTSNPYYTPRDPENPYRIAVAGHGGFVARTSVWKEVGGYWQGMNGYGGEETYTDLKYWLLGKEVWLDPKLVHYHWGGKREYNRHFTDSYIQNLLMAANIIGGEKWLYTVYNSFLKSVRFVKTGQPTTPMYDLLLRAQDRSKLHAQQIADRRVKSLDELLAWFPTQNIRH